MLMIFGRVKRILRVRMARVGFMQCRRLLIFCLSTLLLCVSASASVCELSCSLSHVDPVSKPTVGAPALRHVKLVHPKRARPHSHCGHVHKARQGNAANHSVENTSDCSNAPCAQAQTFSLVNSVEDTDSGRVHSSLLLSVPTVAFNVSLSIAKHECALTKFLPLDPLSVSLRI